MVLPEATAAAGDGRPGDEASHRDLAVASGR